MQTRTNIILPAVVTGIGVSALAQVLALVAQEQGLVLVTRILDWPNTILQSLASCSQVESPGSPGCDAPPQSLWAYLASFPISAGVYSIAAYFYFKRKRRAG